MRGTIHVDTLKQRKDTFLRRGRYRWPYIKYSTYLAQPDTLASAGFSFHPVKDAPDNVQCFDCGFELTGWEASDDPFAEHISHRPLCKYAQIHCQTRSSVLGGKIDWIGWPLDRDQKLTKKEMRAEWAKMQEVKKDTAMLQASFERGGWPHQGKQKWTLTPQKLASAGFYFTPEWPGDDTASCVFCGYPLAEWEPDDDPVMEHKKRAPECLYFRLETGLESDEEMVQGADEDGEDIKVKVEPGVRSPKKRLSGAVVVDGGDEDHSDASSADSKRSRVEEPEELDDEPEMSADAEYEVQSEGGIILEVENLADSDADTEIEEAATADYANEEEEEYLDDVDEQQEHNSSTDAERQYRHQHQLEQYDQLSEQDQAELDEPVQGNSADNTQVTAVGDEALHYSPQPGTMPDHEPLGETQYSTQIDEPPYMRYDPSIPGGAAEGMADDDDDWELSESEENMTVEDFIRKCCRQRVSALETSATKMVSMFMQRAEETRDRISSMSW
ncbi:hypothetical protein FBU59_004892 [Linderina macrospora]|uniref:Uncharacterized protein n=1 Tax=Linderina macrospora TaxID=4868 RepID=A0ACC1J481_9FUNG|nr:hypothetical protein FBU59_004892 [Linderina macrospora]